MTRRLFYLRMWNSASLCLLISAVPITTGFLFLHKPIQTTFVIQYAAASPFSESLEEDEEPKVQITTQQKFLEEESRKGAAQIASLSTAERTQRALIAEAVEDQMNRLQDQLEDLLYQPCEKEGQEEKKEKLQALTIQLQTLQKDYKDLVSGKDCIWITTGAFE